MTQNISLQLSQISRLPTDEIGMPGRYFASLSIDEQAEVFKQFSELIEQPGDYLKVFGQWLMTVMNYRQKKKSIVTNKPNDLKRQIEVFDRKLAKQRLKTSPEKKFILKHLDEIRELRAQGKSWRYVSEFLKVHHKREISFSYLRKCVTEIEGGV